MAPKRTRQRSNKPTRELSFFTVMISRGLGKVRTFSVSSWFLLWAFIVGLLYLVGSSVGTYLYLEGLNNDRVQTERVGQLASETRETQRVLYQARQRLKLLEEIVYKGQIEEKQGTGDSKSEASFPVVREASASQGRAPNGPTEEISLEPVVTIQQLTTKRSRERLAVNFRLVRTRSDGSQLCGYLFIVAANTASDPPRFWTRPVAILKDGVPVDYTRGQAFKVRNYRVIREQVAIESGADPPSLLSILAYDTNGNLVLDEAFAIEDSQ